MIRINTYDFWDDVIDYYFDNVWPDEEHGSIISWVQREYNCEMDGNTAVFRNPAAATLFQLRWM